MLKPLLAKSLLALSSLAFTSLAFSSNAFAGESIHSLEFDGTTLTLTYLVGGGCKKHVADFHVELSGDLTGGDSRSAREIVAKLSVTDRTETGDPNFCQAIIPVQGTVNVRGLINRELEKQGIAIPQAGMRIKVILPETEYSL